MSSALYECTFEPGGWNEGDWIEVRSPRWDHPGGWLQQEDHVSNRVPTDATAKEMLGPRGGETYSSMLVADLLGGDMRVRTSASFDFRMAPLIVFAGPLGIDRGGHPEYREHVEIVLFDEGINVWHHTWAGQPKWVRAAWWRFELVRGERHILEVERRGADWALRVGAREFGCRIEGLPEGVGVGMTGCEGINRFYEFVVHPLEK